MNTPAKSSRWKAHLLCRRAHRLARGKNDVSGARKLLDQAARAASSDARPLLAAARLEIQQERYEPALDLARQARQRQPDNPACLLHEGQALFHLGRYGEAQKAFERTLSLDSRNMLAGNFLAFCHLQQNRAGEFRSLLSRHGLWHRPDLIRIAWTQRKLPLLDLHQEAVKKQPSPPDQSRPSKPSSLRQAMAMARRALHKKSPRQALEALEHFTGQGKKNAAYLFLLGEAAVRCRDTARALPLLEGYLKSLQKEPGDPYFFFLLGQCCHFAGNYDAAVGYYQRGEPHTTIPYYAAVLQYYAALSLLAAKHYKKAGERIEQAASADSLLAGLIAASLTGLFCHAAPLKEIIDEE